MHRNQLDKIRILAALVVIFSHHYPLTGNTPPAWLETPWLNWSMMGGIGVMVFFCISGYLVTQSWYRQPEFFPFLWKRVLRLWPGMLGSVLCGVFLFGLLSRSQSLAEYLQSTATWHFLWINLTLIQEYGTIPGAFVKTPNPGAVNGVYWTIPMEFICYLILAGLGLAGILRKTVLFKILLLIYIASFLWFENSDITGRINHWVEYPAFFASGALIALHQEWFRLHGGKLLFYITPLLAAIYFLTPYTGTSRFFLLSPLIIYLGNLPAKENWLSRLGDPSYGIYLYGYPIAQSVETLWPDMRFLPSLLLTFAFSICAGYASWLLLESRALRWKNNYPNSKKLVNQN
ncbi:acyltransferase 3 [Delftia sp. Cs1-4]|uniref:acyltransferase family protein n=1 Tax=Delftia sp. (strain Cs1-4) TaxID=742013 RepID=UPI00020E7D5A|nr:acyltransferase [Delftia sp. Cs1-4]AEF87703.1 acyltransferase 3 [Delftia sp. Cs1-4]